MAEDKASKTYMDMLARSLGRVVMTCSHLEHDITMVIAEILSLNEVQERALVRPMGTSTKLSLLNRIATDYLDKDDCKRVKKITESISDALEKRNELIHGLYVHSQDRTKAAVLVYSGASRIRGKPVELDPREIELLIVQLNHLADELAHARPLFPKIEKAPARSHALSSKNRND